MDHRDHVALLRDGVPPRREAGAARSVWADLGSGGGAFTLALADLLGAGAVILSIDRDARALDRQAAALAARFPAVDLRVHVADFSRPIEGLPPLDGVVMANSLHFERDKLAVLSGVRGHLRPGGRFILVEYDTDAGNPWVPYPVSFDSWRALAEAAGLRDTRLLAAVPSSFLGSIYSALSLR